jgi:hypothetical protein
MVKVMFSEGLILPVNTRTNRMQVKTVNTKAINEPVFLESHDEFSD